MHTMRQGSLTLSSEPHLHHETPGVISRARARWHYLGKHVLASRKHKSDANKDAHKLSNRENMQCVDCFDGGTARRSGGLEERRPVSLGGTIERSEDFLFEIRPEVDGRLTDIRRASITSR